MKPANRPVDQSGDRMGFDAAAEPIEPSDCEPTVEMLAQVGKPFGHAAMTSVIPPIPKSNRSWRSPSAG
jgi:hypothetical protein